MKALIALSIVFGLSACASTPVAGVAPDVPLARILDAAWLQPSPSRVPVVVKRDSGAVGASCDMRLYVNAKPVADLRATEKLILQVTPGDHILSINTPEALCSGRMSEVKITVRDGEPSTYRISTTADGLFAIGPTAF